MTATNRLYYGRDTPLPPQIPLKAGPLSLMYEAGDLRTIKLGQVEIIRRIYVAVRDPGWDTIQPVITNEQILAEDDSFRISYDVTNRRGAIDFFWQGSIIGGADGTITFSMEGKAKRTFWRNRIGFCVLHPMSCAGLPARIEHVDGSVETSTFPVLIAPQLVKEGHPWPVAPFDNMRALSHQVRPGLWAQVRLNGDIFEMEDQRNWTDASFKTYGTPLRLPIPVLVPAGTAVCQFIQVRLIGEPPPTASPPDEERVTTAMTETAGQRLPSVGLGVAGHGRALTQTEINRLQALNLAHLRVDVTPSTPGYQARLQQAAAEAGAINTPLAIALFLTENAADELADLVRFLPRLKTAVAHWLIFHRQAKTTPAWLADLARQRLRRWEPTAVIIGGTNGTFTDINANRPPAAALDGIAYSLNPQVHAFDNHSLTETLAAQGETVRSARHFAAGKPIFVGPVTLKPRFNPHAVKAEPAPVAGDLPPDVDERQSSLYGAGWTLGSLKYLAESGAARVTYYQTTGWQGVMALADGEPLPDKFWSLPGGVYPLYHLLADVAEMAHGRLLPTQSSHPLLVNSLLLADDHGRMLLLANFTPHPQTAVLGHLPPVVQLRRLNETNVLEAMGEPENFRQRSFHPLTPADGRLALEMMPFEMMRLNF